MTRPGRPFAASDSAWLHMDRSDNPMVVNGIFELEGRWAVEEARALVQERMLEHRRFVQRVLDPDSIHPRWEDDPDFSIDRHIVEETVAGDDDAVHRVIDDIASTNLPMDRPLWSFHLFPRPDGRTWLLCRIHHCVADGIALMRVLLSISDEEAGKPKEQGRRRKRDWLRSTLGTVASAVAKPRKVIGEAVGYAEVSARLIFRRPDPRTALRGQLGGHKKTAWSKPIPLELVKRTGKAKGATINDVLTAAVSGALRRYLSNRGGSTRAVRAMVPVNLRPLTGPIRLGNRFGLVMLDLPIHEAEPLQRLFETKRRMDFLKGAREAVVAFVFIEALGQLSRRFEAPFLHFFSEKASLVLTNVPGPRQRLHLGGREIRRMMFWVPQSGSIGLGVSIISYAGEVVVGVMSDGSVIEHPGELVAAYEDEVRALAETILGPEALPKAG